MNRIIIKYSGSQWNTMQNSNYLVELLQEHLGLIQDELAEVQSGERKLSYNDYLGPQTRAAMSLNDSNTTTPNKI